MDQTDDEIVPFTLRLPFRLKQKLALEAKGNIRSLNSEMVKRLSDSFEEGPKLIESGYRTAITSPKG